MLKDVKFGFVGSGQMGQAIFRGMVYSKEVCPENICVTDIDETRLETIRKDLGVNTLLSDKQNSGAVALASAVDVLVLAVSPQLAKNVLQSIAGALPPQTLVVSIMGGITLDFIEAIVPQSPVIRVMPNTPLMVRKGVSGIAMGQKTNKEHEQFILDMFGLLGAAYILPENLIDPFTGVCGCSPAFAYLFMDAIAMGGVERGLPAAQAIRMVAQSIAGAAEMIIQTGKHPGELIANVCTPAGSTIAGIHSLEEKAFKGIVMSALCESCDRMLSVGEKA